MARRSVIRSHNAVNQQAFLALSKINLEVLGERLRRARLERKISQRDLCQNLFTSAYLSSLELGKTRPTLTTLEGLSQRLEKSLDYFLRPTSEVTTQLDEEQARTLEARLNLLNAEIAVERQDQEQAERALQEVEQNLGRFSNLENGFFYCLRGRFFNLAQNPQAAIQELERARSHLANEPEPRPEVFALAAQIENELGQAALLQNRVMSAQAHFQAALERLDRLGESSPVEMELRWKLWSDLGRSYLRIDDRDQAAKAFNQALTYQNRYQDPAALADLFLRQAQSYTERGEFWQASQYMGRAQQAVRARADYNKLLDTYSLLARLQTRLGEYQAAELNARRAFSLSMVSLSETERCRELESLVTIASLRQKQGQYQEARSLIDEALGLQQNCGGQLEQGQLHLVAGEIMAGSGDREKARQHYRKALEQLENLPADTKDDALLAEVYYSYGQRLKEWEDTNGAFEYLERAYALRQHSR